MIVFWRFWRFKHLIRFYYGLFVPSIFLFWLWDRLYIQYLSYLPCTFYFDVYLGAVWLGFIRFIGVRIPVPGRAAIREGFTPSRVFLEISRVSRRAGCRYYLSLPTHTRKENRLPALYTIHSPGIKERSR